MLLVLLSTLSRSGALGLGVGLVVLAFPYRRFVWSRALLVPLAGVGVVLAYVLYRRWDYFSVVLRSRVQTGGASSSAHFAVYDFIPQIIHSHPLFGLGLNTFSVYYEFVTGKTNWGPHSFWVALIVETGLVGLVLFVVFLRYVYLRLRAARRLPDRLPRACAYGMTAALTGTIAANFFYLTMSFYYFYAFAALALALPIVFSRDRAQVSAADGI
jgi:O-antigen ligase